MGESKPRSEAAAGGRGVRLCRCVVLASPQSDLPRVLLRGLEQRGAVAIVATDAAAAMVDLAYSGAGALIVHEPEHQPRLADLLDAVHRYFPRTTCWQYQTGRVPALARLNGHDPHTTAQVAPPASSADEPAAHADAQQRHEISRRLDTLIVRVPNGPASAHEPLISDEELAMLLGPTPDDDDRSERAADPDRRPAAATRSRHPARGSRPR